MSGICHTRAHPDRNRHHTRCISTRQCGGRGNPPLRVC